MARDENERKMEKEERGEERENVEMVVTEDADSGSLSSVVEVWWRV